MQGRAKLSMQLLWWGHGRLLVYSLLVKLLEMTSFERSKLFLMMIDLLTAVAYFAEKMTDLSRKGSKSKGAKPWLRLPALGASVAS
jgi:cell division protein FtsW (lipid II flippase)